MMHHPNIHHPMGGHPAAQHMQSHQGMPGQHQMPHPMHRDTRVPMGRSQPNNGMGAAGGHGPAMSGMGAPMGVHPQHLGPAQRPTHAIRPMAHHSSVHHSVPPPMKQMRRPYGVGAGGGYAGGVLHAPYVPPPPPAPLPPARALDPPPVAPIVTTIAAGLCRAPSPDLAGPVSVATEYDAASGDTGAVEGAGGAGPVEGAGGGAQGDSLPLLSLANSKEKTPMCLVNELARFNKIKHQYRLTSESGPAHKKIFTVTLRLGDTEEYTAEGSSIKRAQHAAASAALARTSHPAPPARANAAHEPPNAPHLRHTGAVMPTVELNALAMKLCQPALYTAVLPPPMPRLTRMRAPYPPYRMQPPFAHPSYNQRLACAPGAVYRVRLQVGARGWLGEGPTPQSARHDAAARALVDLRTHEAPAPAPDSPDANDSTSDLLNSEVKSPVSLVHELALKRNLSVLFTVKSERGPPHMRVFVTTCSVGDMEAEGEGNGKKVSKKRAAEAMLDEMRRRWPPAALRPPRPAPKLKRKPQPPKKKTRNLIKENGSAGTPESGEGPDNPISRLAVARHAARARSPQYRVLEERGAARRREFLVQCEAPPFCANGLGPNKKTAKRRAAHNVLQAMELGGAAGDAGVAPAAPEGASTASDSKPDPKLLKEGSVSAALGAAGGEARQPVPGVLLMDYHPRPPAPPLPPLPPSGVSEASIGSVCSSGAKDQLMYLSQLLGFTVQFSDFPKRNHGEYLSLVSLSTEPPVMCHGGGASTAQSHEQCSRAALRALTLMGLDAPTDQMPGAVSTLPKPAVLSNGASE